MIGDRGLHADVVEVCLHLDGVPVERTRGGHAGEERFVWILSGWT